MINYRKSGGWRGNSYGHSLAARGVRLYARKQSLSDPLFYAKSREDSVPFTHLVDMIREGKSFQEIKRMHPDADSEDLRLRGIKAIENVEGNSTLSTINSNGVDLTVKMANSNKQLKEDIEETLNDGQKASFLAPIKVEMLKKRLKE